MSDEVSAPFFCRLLNFIQSFLKCCSASRRNAHWTVVFSGVFFKVMAFWRALI